MSHDAIAPPGWGYRPGVPMMHCDGNNLPALPMLRLINGTAHRRACILDAIEQSGIDASTVTPAHLRERYGITFDESERIVGRAQRGAA